MASRTLRRRSGATRIRLPGCTWPGLTRSGGTRTLIHRSGDTRIRSLICRSGAARVRSLSLPCCGPKLRLCSHSPFALSVDAWMLSASLPSGHTGAEVLLPLQRGLHSFAFGLVLGHGRLDAPSAGLSVA